MAKKSLRTAAGLAVGNEEIFSNAEEGKNAGMSIGGRNSSRGLKEQSSIGESFDEEGNVKPVFNRIKGITESNTPRVSNSRPPKCDATDRPHPPAVNTVFFKDHPTHKSNSLNMCDFHTLQYQDDPHVDLTIPLDGSDETNKAARRRSYLRKIGKRNDSAEKLLAQTGTAPLLQNSGRPKPAYTQSTVDESLAKDYGDIEGFDLQKAIEESERRGGRSDI